MSVFGHASTKLFACWAFLFGLSRMYKDLQEFQGFLILSTFAKIAYSKTEWMQVTPALPSDQSLIQDRRREHPDTFTTQTCQWGFEISEATCLCFFLMSCRKPQDWFLQCSTWTTMGRPLWRLVFGMTFLKATSLQVSCQLAVSSKCRSHPPCTG